MKKLLSVCLAALLLLSFVPVVFAEETGITALSVNPYGGEEADMDTVSWFAADGKYFLFLPADFDLSAAKVYYTAAGGVTLDGAAVVSGESAAAFTEGDHTLACGEQTYPLTVLASANIPTVFITTESGSLDYIHANKENKEPGNIRVYENGVQTLNKPLKQIKGRGNSTWTAYPKKPYNIKFDKKTAVLGMPQAKKWTLLANYLDYSLIHNAYGWEFANAFDLPYTSEYRHADLYINGDYKGNYVICESVEVGDNRVEVGDLEKANEKANSGVDIEALPIRGTGANGAVQSGTVKGSRKWVEIPNDPADITGGYLLEYEYAGRYNNEPCGFVTYNGQPIVIKSPEYASMAEVNYIAGFMDEANEALYSETGYNALGKHYSDYFDVESLVNMYLLQELSMNFDAAFSSFFAYKPEGEDSKLVFSPVWDMDNAFGSEQANLYTTPGDTSIWWANQMGVHTIPTVLTAAFRHEAFRSAVKTRWAALHTAGAFETVNETVAALRESLRPSATMNLVRWNRIKTRDPAAAEAGWESFANRSVNHVATRTAAMDRGLGANGAYLYYDINGAYSWEWALVSAIKEVGENITVRTYTGNGTVEPPAGTVFYCWNTAADGSGTSYQPGDTLTLESEATVLYAIWKTQAEIDALNAAALLAADKAAFEEAKDAALSAVGDRAQAGDSEAAQQLISDARAAIAALPYDEELSLEENLATINGLLGALDTDLAAQREADLAAAQPDDNGGSGVKLSFWQRILAFFRSVIDFFRWMFRRGT